jgi:acetolactate synthase-1/2/3 large subunit
VRVAVELLTAPGAKPFCYAGLGGREAQDELIAIAERLEAPVATTIQGKGVFPESHPLFLWNGFGNQAPEFVRNIVQGRNVTLALGCRFSEVGTGGYGLTPPGHLIHVDINPAALSRNFPAELAVVSDAGAFLRAVLAALPATARPSDDALRENIRAGHAAVRKGWVERKSPARVTPYVLLEAMQRRFGPDAVYVTDSGNGTFLAMEGLRLDHPGKFLSPVDYSCMGYSVPAAIGAKLGCPEAPVVALAGDGAFLMTGLELLTAANQGIPIAVFVLRDRELAQIAQFQSTAFNRRTASALPDYHLGGLAEGMGVEWLPLDRDEQVESVILQAQAILAERRPVIVDTAIDYSDKTYFTRGVVKTMLGRLPWPDRLRFIARAISRRISG